MAHPLPLWRAGQVGLGPPGGLTRDESLASFRSVNAGPNHTVHYQIQQQFSPESDNQEEEAFPTAWAQIRKDHLHPPRPRPGPACSSSFPKLEASWLGPCASVPGQGARSHAPGSQLVCQVEPAKVGGAWHLQLNNGCCGTEVGVVARPSGTHRRGGGHPEPGGGDQGQRVTVHTRPHVLYQRGQL